MGYVYFYLLYSTASNTALDGLSTIVRTEGVLGLFRGTSLALVGVSNGAIQFVAYEKMKKWGFDRKKRQHQKAGREWNVEADKLVCPNPDYPLHPPDVIVTSRTRPILSCLYQVNLRL